MTTSSADSAGSTGSVDSGAAAGWARVPGRRRLGLRTRLLGALLVTVVACLAVLWSSTARMSDLAQQSRDVYVTGTVPVDALRSLQVSWWMYRAESALAEAAEPGSDDEAGHGYASDRALAVVDGQQDLVAAAALAPAARASFLEFRVAVEHYEALQDEVRAQRAAGQPVPADAEGRVDEAAHEASSALERATSEQGRAASEQSARSAQDLASGRRTLAVVVGIALLLAALATVAAVRSVVRPLRELRRALGRIGGADAAAPDTDEDLLLALSRDVAVVEAAQRADRVFRRTVEAFPFAVVLVDRDAHVHHGNAEAQRLLALPAGAGRTRQVARVHPPHRDTYLTALDTALAGRENRVEIDVLGVLGADPDAPGAGPRRRCEVSFVPLGEDAGALVCFTDITETASLHRELVARAERDPLTGCANRTTAMGHLAAAMAESPHGGSVGLLYLDLDGFKAVNDGFGHGTGDLLLLHVASTLTAMVRPGDLVGRMGGDEFVVVLAPVSGQEGCDTAANRVRAQLEGLIALASADVHLRVSVGAAVARIGETPAELVARADDGMYEEKRARREIARRVTPRY